ncbi:MAG: hypothetical protein JO111_01080 [Caulobacteraceae bacterium]|nr:hypothetical protein [Caulobacteraceae bacterium]
MTGLAERMNGWRFSHAIKAILDTPPAPRGAARFTALSMVRTRDVLPYLLAIKSFVRFARPERVLVVADPTLTDGDRALIRRHVPHVEILPPEAFRHPSLPQGGTWERLAAIAALNADESIVQLDADTVTFDEPTEVVEAASNGGTFVISSEAGVRIVDLASASRDGVERQAHTSHIQVAAEARLAELPEPGSLRYARGCSGFTGFGRGALAPNRLREFSAQMREFLGARWDEWGTEQVASNLLAASTPGAFLLPHPRYCNADSLGPATIFAHYAGYVRFRTRDYEIRARRAVQLLSGRADNGLQDSRQMNPQWPRP